MPFSSSGADLKQLDKIIKVPIWAFHSENNKPEGDRETISHLQRKGGCCHLTEIPGAEHNCWFRAFKDYNPLEWLLAQRRGSECNPPLDSATDYQLVELKNRWWLWAIAITILVTVIVVALQQRYSTRTK